jgi:hypothetical protein
MLALRVGGKQVFGDYPYHEAAYIGGANTLRGFPKQRFAGDASAFGSAELRIPVTRVYILVPGQLGVFALGMPDVSSWTGNRATSGTRPTAAGCGFPWSIRPTV